MFCFVSIGIEAGEAGKKYPAPPPKKKKKRLTQKCSSFGQIFRYNSGKVLDVSDCKHHAFHIKEERMETTFSCKTTTFAHNGCCSERISWSTWAGAGTMTHLLPRYACMHGPYWACFGRLRSCHRMGFRYNSGKVLDVSDVNICLPHQGRTYGNNIRDNLPLTLHELAQAPTKDSDALDIETIGNLEDSVLRPLDDLVTWCWCWRQSGIRISTSEHCDAVKSPKLNYL